MQKKNKRKASSSNINTTLPKTGSHGVYGVTQTTTPLTSLSQSIQQSAKKFSIPQFSTSTSLDSFFKPYISSVYECFLFLERYIGDDDLISTLVETFKKDPTKFTSSFSLDSLCKESNVNPGELRRLIISTIDFLSNDEAAIKIALSKASLVQKSLDISMDDTHPDSHITREKWLEFTGYRLVKKDIQPSVNVNIQANNTVQQSNTTVNGLPSFGSIISQGEKAISTTMEQLKLEAHPNVIDIEAFLAKKEEDVLVEK